MGIYKSCDIRGHYGSELTGEHARRLGQALARLYGPVTLLVGGDGRVSTPLLKGELIESLLAAGCGVVDIGQVSTPMFYFARAHLGLEVGVMVTASHNPAADNGFKITPGPLPITDEQMAAIAAAMENPALEPPRGALGSLRELDILPIYLDFIQPYIPDLSGLRVVIDCANGMGSLTADPVWRATNAQVNLLLAEVDGRFPAHAPNPAEVKNLAMLRAEVLRVRADLGVAYDGDADRVCFVDERGGPVSGDQAIVLFAQGMLADGPQAIVYDQKCSRVVPERIRAGGGTAIMERSGHTHIKRAYFKADAAYAGELSGHHFLRPFGDDALIASLYFANLLKRQASSLAQMLAQIPAYATSPDLRLPMAEARVREVIEVLRVSLQDEAALNTLDGLRIEYPDGWGLIRPSVTEPVVTLRFEGDNPAALRRIMARVEACVPELRGKLNVD
jgi:phosphomannomutase/phosphoglucomutase